MTGLLKKKRIKRLGFGLGGLVILGLTVVFLGSGFSGCMSFSITEEEAAAQFRAHGLDPPSFETRETNPGSIHFVSVGEGENSIVFVHGSPGSWSAFIRFLMNEDLRESGRLISVDRPGFGLSKPLKAVPSIEEQSRRIHEALSQSGVSKNVVLVGHSLAGPVIARMAFDYPDFVKGLILVAPSMDPELEKRKWYNYVAKFPLVKWSISKDWANSNDEIFPHKSELIELAELLPKLDTPTIVIQGMEDELVPPGNADYVEKIMSGMDRLEIWRIEGLNHFVPWRRPDLIDKAIGELL